MSRRPPRTLRLEDLPREARRVLEALVLGEEVELARGDRTLGTLSYHPAVLEGVVVPAPRAEEPVEVPDGVTVVAAVVPMSADARRRLADAFGEEYVVLDVNEAPDTADVVLTHPVSPQLLGMLRARFTRARILVTEVDDDDLGISRRGPVSRLLDAGASAYLPPRPLDEVAHNVRTFLETAQGTELTAAEERPARQLPTPREP